MHLPAGAVKQKMTAEGLDPAILDMDPNSPAPSAGGGGGGGSGGFKSKLPRRESGPTKEKIQPAKKMKGLFWSKVI